MKLLKYALLLLFCNSLQAAPKKPEGMHKETPNGIHKKTPDIPNVEPATPEEMAEMEQNSHEIQQMLKKLAESLKNVTESYADIEELMKNEKEIVECSALDGMKEDIVNTSNQLTKTSKSDPKYKEYEEDLKVYETSHTEYQKRLIKYHIKCATINAKKNKR